MRRIFLDDLIEQVEAGYGATRRHYRRVLTQRNALLKQSPRDLAEQLFVWNLRLSELGGKIARARLKLVDDFNTRASGLYGDLAGRTTDVSLRYGSRFQADAYESQLLHKLESNVRLEVERGFTAYGPHRDDLLAFIDGRAVQDAASRGETRTLVLVLKMLELHLLETGRGEKPLLLLDDVFSELDARRREALTAHVQTHQTFITTTDADVVSHHFAASNIISLA
jgi:DNA replication and repair protein RecF